MNISKKWQAALAGAIALALVGGGTVSASAAPGYPDTTPQPNGSPGAFYIFDENAALAETPGQVFQRDQYLFGASDNVDYLSEIDPDDYAAPGTWDTVYKFVAKSTELTGGTGSWRAYALDAAAGPNGGVLTPALTLGDLGLGNGGGIESIFTEGGDWLVGIAFTTNNGVTPVGSVYRTIHVNAANDTYTYEAITPPPPPPGFPEWNTFAGTVGASAVVFNGNLEIDATVANAGKTVDVYAEGASTNPVHTGIVLDAAGKAIQSSSIAAGTRIALDADGSAPVDAWITTTVGAGYTKPVTGDPNLVTIANPAEGVQNVMIDAGIANAGATLTPVVWVNDSANATPLSRVPLDASGVATVPNVPFGTHTIGLFNATRQVVVWGTVTLTNTDWGPGDHATGSPADSLITATVTTSNRFELQGVATSADLGPIRRGQTTAPKPLGAFSVIDDRDDRKGWTLSAAAAEFVNTARNDTAPASSLSLAPKAVGTLPTGITLGTGGAAGSPVTLAEGAVDSFTSETGTQFDTDLTFAAPSGAKAGVYSSTLTLTLLSK